MKRTEAKAFFGEDRGAPSFYGEVPTSHNWKQNSWNGRLGSLRDVDADGPID